jgi:hypothetical protein
VYLGEINTAIGQFLETKTTEYAMYTVYLTTGSRDSSVSTVTQYRPDEPEFGFWPKK